MTVIMVPKAFTTTNPSNTGISNRKLKLARLPLRRPRFEPRSSHMGFVLDKVELGQIFSEYFSFPCQFSFHLLLHIQHHLSSGAATIGQLLADVPSGLSLTPPQETKEKVKTPFRSTYTYDEVSEVCT
jgi:hypothetical protein